MQRAGRALIGRLLSPIRIASVVLSILAGWPAVVRSEPIVIEPAEMPIAAVRRDFVGANVFSVERAGNRRLLRSVPNRSASGFYQEVPPAGMPSRAARWSWRVDKLHRSADIRLKEREDFGAMVAFVFGEPSWINRDVPTLAYVWTSTPIPAGSIVKSARLSNLAYVQLRDAAHVGTLHEEWRNLIEDYTAAFGRPPGPLRYIAILNDNDQTGETASALFGPITIDREH